MKENIGVLVDRFADACRKHAVATQNGDYKATHKHNAVIDETYCRLMSFDDEGKSALLELTQSKEIPLALNAAAMLIGSYPSVCCPVLKAIAKDRGILGLIAKGALERWKEGNLDFEKAWADRIEKYRAELIEQGREP
jgi:hypothetical protein